MNKLLSFSATVIFMAVLNASLSFAQTTVYTNHFTGTGGASPSPGGTPPLAYTVTSAGTDATVGSGQGAQIGGSAGTVALTDNQLACWVTAATVPTTTNDGYAYATGLLSGFPAPFDPTLSSNTVIINWTFNMRASTPVSGFAAGQNEGAVVLVASDPDIRGAGSGYAVIHNPGLVQGFQLVKFTGGLTGTVTPIISSSASLSSATNYASIKVTYVPSLNQWTIYVRDDGSAGFSDPSTGVVISEGSVVDATYTSTLMSHFGFYANYDVTYSGSGDNAQYEYFDEFEVTTSCPQIDGGSATCVGLTTTLTNSLPGGTWTSLNPSVATIDPVTGVVTGISADTVTITYESGTCLVVTLFTVYAPTPIPPDLTGDSVVCVGSTITVDGGPPFPGAFWSSSDASVAAVGMTTGVVTGMHEGTATITYSYTGGCFKTKTVTVNPAAPVVGFPFLCVGDVLTLSNAVPGGTWSSTSSTIASVDGTGSVTAVGPGTATISYILPTGCYATIVATVNSLPGPITGVATVCVGSTSPLSSTPAGGFWSSSNETVASVSDVGLLIGNSAGTSLITYKLETGCQVTREVTVNPTPEAPVGPDVLCAGDTATYTNTLAGGTWSTSSSFVATVNVTTGLVTGINAGTANITYRMPTGCFRYTTITVNATPAAISGTLAVCQGLTTTLTSSSGGTWTSLNTSTATVGASTGLVTGVAADTVTIRYAFSTGCHRTAVVTVNPLPDAITGTLSVCEGHTTALSETSTGGTWSTSDATIADVDAGSGLVSGIGAGTATIAYTVSTGCEATVVVTVLLTPSAIGGTLVTCIGDNTTLTNTIAGGTWTSSNTGVATVDATSGVVTGAGSGTSTISYTTPNGCFVTAEVTVNSLPAAITGTFTVCQFSNTTLSSTSFGGTWSTSDATVATVSGFGGTVNGVSPGTATITYTRLGCIRTQVVTVNPLPSTFTGSLNTCVGTTTTLSATPAGTWTSSNTSIATVVGSTGVVTGVAAGTSNMTYTISTGCFRARTLTVNPLPPAITGSGTVCPGTSITLSNSIPGGTWTSGSTAIATVVAGTGVVTGATSGTTNISYTISTGCVRTTIVTVAPAPPAVITPLGDTTLCPGGFVTLTGTTTPGVSYQWLLGGTPIGGATSATYTTGIPGSYQFQVNVAVGCSSTSIPMTVAVTPATAIITLPTGSSATCSGTPVVMNANTGVGLTYQWELGGAAISGATASSYSAAVAGTYRVRVTNSAGCWALSSPVAVTVAPTPSDVVTVSGPLSICSGSNVTMTAASGAGYTYQWYNSAGAITGATSASYTAATAEDYYVEVTSGSCTATSAISSVAVNPLPDVTITPGGPLIFCSGGAVNLTAATGFNYQWYKGGVAISGATNSGYVASADGGYRVRVTDAGTGCWDMTHADTVVRVIDAPSLLPSTPAMFCWGGGALLSTSVSGLGAALTYQWYLGGVLIPGATNSTYTATVPGDYHCDISVPSSCTISTPTVPVSEVPLPDPPISSNGVSMLTANYYVTYQWYKDLIAIGGATSWSTPITGNGQYKVAVTDTNGCQSVSNVYVLTGWTPPTGIPNVQPGDVTIFPNPATETVFVTAPVKAKVIISSVDGKALIAATSNQEIGLHSLADGLYLVSVFDESGRLIKLQKLVKQ